MNMESQKRQLHEVCTIERKLGKHVDLPYVGLEDIESHTGRFNGSMEPHAAKSSSFRFSNEHVLYGRLRPYLNKAIAPDFNGHCSTEIFPLKPGPELSREYLLYWLLSHQTCDQINSTATGTRMPRANMNEVMSFSIPVPALATQGRIVRFLDEAFEGIAVAKANAEKNLQNARAIFESKLQFLLTQNRARWEEIALADATKKITDGSHNPPPGVPASQFLMLSSKNVFDDALDYLNPRYLSAENFDIEHKRTGVIPGDVLLTIVGTIGRCAVVPDDAPHITLQRSVAVIRPDQTRATSRFLMYLLMSRRVGLNDLGRGAAQKGIYLESLRTVSVLLPNLEEQARIVEQLDLLQDQTNQLANIYKRKMKHFIHLDASLLHQAFSGKMATA